MEVIEEDDCPNDYDYGAVTFTPLSIDDMFDADEVVEVDGLANVGDGLYYLRAPFAHGDQPTEPPHSGGFLDGCRSGDMLCFASASSNKPGFPPADAYDGDGETYFETRPSEEIPWWRLEIPAASFIGTLIIYGDDLGDLSVGVLDPDPAVGFVEVERSVAPAGP